MLLRHLTTKEKLAQIIRDGYLKSFKTEGSEKGRIYFEEYKGNDFLINFILDDDSKKHLTKDDIVSLNFDSNVLKEHDIVVEQRADQTKTETEIGVGRIFSKEEQLQIGEYYMVINQNVPIGLSTDETKRMIEEFNGKN